MSTHRDIRRISLIVAVGQNGEIGRGGDLLWHLPGDLQYFKRTTMGHPLIMGSRTFRSIGRALPGRISIVVSRDPDYCRTIDSLDACRGVPSVEAALEYVGTLSQDQLPCPHHPFIAGGGQIYRECLEKGLVDEVYLTLVHARYPDADTFFPLEYLNTWQEVSRESHASADGTSPSFDYLRLIPPAEK